MEDIIKLIDLSLEDGRLSPDDYRIILKKAKGHGISEEEFNLILSKRTKHFETNKSIPKMGSSSKLPYILAIIAIVFTFFDWIGAYSRSTVMGNSASWDYSFSGWWGGYGASIILIYAVGCYLYFKSNRFYWVAGLLAIFDAVYIYSAITNADVSVSYGYGEYGGSAEAGYNLLWGFWGFIIASGLFASSALTSGRTKVKIRFKQNFKAGRKTLGLTVILNILLLTLILSLDNSFDDALIISCLFTLAFSIIALFVFILSPSIRSAGYIIVSIAMVFFTVSYFIAGERAELFKVFMTLISFPICFIISDRIITSRSNIKNIMGGAGILLMVFTLSLGCSNQPKSSSKNCQLNGNYHWSDGYQSFELSVIGNNWFGQLMDNTTGNILMNGNGHVDGRNLMGEYGMEMGYQTSNCDISFQGFTGYFTLKKR